MRHGLRTAVVIALLDALLWFAAASPATAASVRVAGVITGGLLSLRTEAASFEAPPTDSGDSYGYRIALSAQDARGNGGGWQETITSTSFAAGADRHVSLPASASTVVGVTLRGTGTSTPPDDPVRYPVAVPAGHIAPSPVLLFDATAGHGMGEFAVTAWISVLDPPGGRAGSYSSTVTLALVAGP